MTATLLRVTRRAPLLLDVVAVALLGVRACESQRAPSLELWHTVVPQELGASEIDKADWATYVRVSGPDRGACS